MYTNESFIESRNLRETCIDRLEVLNKVKALFLIPKVNLMSPGMVAKFFDVPVKTIQKTYERNADELLLDGIRKWKAGEIFNGDKMSALNPVRVQGGVLITCTDGQRFQLPNRESVYYTPRSIMRLAMLLRDSTVAREVRTQLLNIVERTAPEERTVDIDKENQLLIAAVRADTLENRIAAVSDLLHFKNRHIEKMQATIDTLLNEAQHMDFGQTMNSLIKAYALRYKGPLYGANDAYHAAWNNLYYRLRTAHGIDVRRRIGKGSMLSKIRDCERQMAIRVAAELAQGVGVDIVTLLGEQNINNYHLN